MSYINGLIFDRILRSTFLYFQKGLQKLLPNILNNLTRSFLDRTSRRNILYFQSHLQTYPNYQRDVLRVDFGNKFQKRLPLFRDTPPRQISQKAFGRRKIEHFSRKFRIFEVKNCYKRNFALVVRASFRSRSSKKMPGFEPPRHLEEAREGWRLLEYAWGSSQRLRRLLLGQLSRSSRRVAKAPPGECLADLAKGGDYSWRDTWRMRANWLRNGAKWLQTGGK